MRVTFLCGHCRGAMAADASNAGAAVACPHCQAVLEVPGLPPSRSGFGGVDAPDPPKSRRRAAPEPAPEPEPRPTRKSSAHLRRSSRSLQPGRRRGQPGNATKAALILLLALVVVAGVATVTVVLPPGRDAKKDGLALGGAVPGAPFGGGAVPGAPFGGDVAPGARPAVPPGWKAVVVGRSRVSVPPQAAVGRERVHFGVTTLEVQLDAIHVVVAFEPNAPGEGEPLLSKMARQGPGGETKSIGELPARVSGYRAREFRMSFGSDDPRAPDFGRLKYSAVRWVQVGKDICTVHLTGETKEASESDVFRNILDSFEVVP